MNQPGSQGRSAWIGSGVGKRRRRAQWQLPAKIGIGALDETNRLWYHWIGDDFPCSGW